MLVLVACEAEVELEPAPDAISGTRGCPEPTEPAGGSVSGDWGTATGNPPDGVAYELNPGWSVTICVEGAQGRTSTVTIGPDDPRTGQAPSPLNPANQNPELNRFSVTGITPPDQTTTTEPSPPPPPPPPPDGSTTTTAGEPTTTAADGTTTITQAGDTTTTAADGAVTVTQASGTTTTIAGQTTTTAGDGATTVTQAGGDTATTGPDGEADDTGDDTEAGDDTDDTLAFTGPSGPIGPGYLTVVAAALMLLGWGLLRRRSE